MIDCSGMIIPKAEEITKTSWHVGSLEWNIASDAFSNLKLPIKYHHESKPKIPRPKKILYHGIATIVFWEDGTKTVVKRAEGDPDNKYNAFCSALAIKIYGNNSRVNKHVKSGITQK